MNTTVYQCEYKISGSTNTNTNTNEIQMCISVNTQLQELFWCWHYYTGGDIPHFLISKYLETISINGKCNCILSNMNVTVM